MRQPSIILECVNVPPYCVQREPESDSVWGLRNSRGWVPPGALPEPRPPYKLVIGPCTARDAQATYLELGTRTHP